MGWGGGWVAGGMYGWAVHGKLCILLSALAWVFDDDVVMGVDGSLLLGGIIVVVSAGGLVVVMCGCSPWPVMGRPPESVGHRRLR